jgi:type I restriction enzyme, S subunit
VNLRFSKIGDVVSTIQSWNPTSEAGDATFPYIDLSSVDNDEKRVRSVQSINFKDAPSRARQLVRSGDILVSTVRPNLNGVAKLDDNHEGTTASTGFCVLRANASVVSPEYLFQWVKSPAFISEMVRKATGASYPAISDRIIAESLLPLPPLDEQRRIAAILDQADDLRRKRREALERLQRLPQMVFVKLFGDAQSNPRRWSTRRIDEVCSVIVDCVNRTAPISEITTPYKMIRTTNVRNGVVDLTEFRCVDEATFMRWNRRATPRRGDVLLTREAPVGEVGALATDDMVFLGQRLMLYRADEIQLTSSYLLWAFTQDFARRQFNRAASGSTVKHIPLPACRMFELRVPPIDLQQAFAARVAEIDALKVSHRAHLAKLNALFASLQRRAFRGEL